MAATNRLLKSAATQAPHGVNAALTKQQAHPRFSYGDLRLSLPKCAVFYANPLKRTDAFSLVSPPLRPSDPASDRYPRPRCPRLARTLIRTLARAHTHSPVVRPPAVWAICAVCAQVTPTPVPAAQMSHTSSASDLRLPTSDLTPAPVFTGAPPLRLHLQHAAANSVHRTHAASRHTESVRGILAPAHCRGCFESIGARIARRRGVRAGEKRPAGCRCEPSQRRACVRRGNAGLERSESMQGSRAVNGHGDAVHPLSAHSQHPAPEILHMQISGISAFSFYHHVLGRGILALGSTSPSPAPLIHVPQPTRPPPTPVPHRPHRIARASSPAPPRPRLLARAPVTCTPIFWAHTRAHTAAPSSPASIVRTRAHFACDHLIWSSTPPCMSDVKPTSKPPHPHYRSPAPPSLAPPSSASSLAPLASVPTPALERPLLRPRLRPRLHPRLCPRSRPPSRPRPSLPGFPAAWLVHRDDTVVVESTQWNHESAPPGVLDIVDCQDPGASPTLRLHVVVSPSTPPLSPTTSVSRAASSLSPTYRPLKYQGPADAEGKKNFFVYYHDHFTLSVTELYRIPRPFASVDDFYGNCY
ncbi:hypothetical protein DFH08DRAFT_1070554 [Mycena albidolilacea]|uniref:Uncharacterized protein n=1 Tax=Mycena albidolilacea TaxID=1033008 RepID=A0AAD7ATS1_9AGAR|nr:hypothetical protein DFH08DRAFT_1070554 [Mycena albidolilacea]